MDYIVYIEFKKSRSSKFNKTAALAKTLPNYSFENGLYSLYIDNIRDYIFYQEDLHTVIDNICNWVGSKVVLLGEQYHTEGDWFKFIDMLKKDAGKYAPVIENIGDISVGGVTFEGLPLPFVWYPNLYGSFFCFSEDIDSQVYFCECEREAIDNCLALNQISDKSMFENSWIPLSKVFPNIIMKDYEQWGSRLKEHIRYKEKICFRCNHKVPKKSYCLPMYGGTFSQHYGWYINQEYYRLGIDKSFIGQINVLKERCTPELYDTVLRINSLIEKGNNSSEMNSLRNDLNRVIENSVREQFGFRKIGDAWVSETMLYNIIREIFKGENIIKHYRSEWLEGLELDIYIPDEKIGFEYQGIQHFEPIEHWGGQLQLEKQKEHDARKKRLCNALNVKLICVNYDEPLTEELVLQKIREAESE